MILVVYDFIIQQVYKYMLLFSATGSNLIFNVQGGKSSVVVAAVFSTSLL